MKNYKYRLSLVIGLALFLLCSLIACAKSKGIPYAPDFTLPSLNGETVSLSDFLGKPVMLTFWTTNCPACEFQTPYIQAFYNEWSDQDIAVLTINAGDSAARVQDYITSHKLTYPVLLDQQTTVAQEYGVPGVPMTFFIDAEGILKAYKVGPFQSQKAIESALKSVFPSLTFTLRIEVGPEIGKLAPDFTLQTTDNQSITLSDLRGETVFLKLWASSCTACIDEMTYLQTVFDEQASEELAILAVNCGETSQTVQKATDGLGLTFPILLDPDGKICTDYKRGFPTTFLIDSNGIIRGIKDDAFQSPDEIKTMLGSI
jgi:peroxiredoxin